MSDPTFEDGARALAEGKPTEAIAAFEALGDHGVVDAVVSYDRALAYAGRVRHGAGEPGDLGRAVHGFEEAKLLSHDAELVRDASLGVDAVRAEIARRRARAGVERAELADGAPLGRALVGLASESAWATSALVFAVLLSVAIVARTMARPGRARVAASTALALALIGLVGTSVLAGAAGRQRRELEEGIVVSDTARLLDDRRITMAGRGPLTEGARVRILGEEAGFRRVEVGSVVGLLPAPSVLPLHAAR